MIYVKKAIEDGRKHVRFQCSRAKKKEREWRMGGRKQKYIRQHVHTKENHDTIIIFGAKTKINALLAWSYLADVSIEEIFFHFFFFVHAPAKYWRNKNL